MLSSFYKTFLKLTKIYYGTYFPKSSYILNITGADLNDLEDVGIFLGYNLSHNPMSDEPRVQWWFIISLIHDSRYRTQIAIDYTRNSSKIPIYIRYRLDPAYHTDTDGWMAWDTLHSA